MPDVKKVLIITNVPQDYRIVLFNDLHEKLAKENIELKVAFGSSGYKRRKGKLDFGNIKFNHVFLDSKKFIFGSVENTMFSYHGLIRLYRSYKPDMTIVIGYSPATIKLWLLSFFSKVNYFIWSGSLKFKGRKDSAFRILSRKILVAKAKGFIAYGSKAKEYLISLGAPAEKIHIAINTVDIDFFNKIAFDRIDRDSGSVKKLLFIGYLSPRKKVDDLIHTIYKLNKIYPDFQLNLVGDGSDREMLITLVNELKLNSKISFEGFKQKNDLPKYLREADCFLFQTGFDIWGLVLNEAMAAGVPSAVSPNAGAVYDLIQNDVNGLIIDFSNHEKAAHQLSELLKNENKLSEMGRNAHQYINNNATVTNSAQGFMDAIISFRKDA